MLNDSTRHRTFSTHEKQTQPGKLPKAKAKSRFADFLIDTNILPLVLIGKAVKCFGWGVVVAFMLGGLSVYGYAVVVKPLPLAKMEMPLPITPAPAPVHQPKMVRLRGVVRDANLRPVTQRFWVGVLANQLGPVQNPEGSFVLEVPESSNYDVALWTSQEQPVSFYNRMPVEPDDKGLKLQDALPFLMPARSVELSAGRASGTRSRNEIARTFADQ
jgi:hypothetical protein